MTAARLSVRPGPGGVPAGLMLGVVAAAAAVILPVGSVLSNLAVPPSATLAHFADTLLAEAVLNSATLVAIVAAGTGVIGVGTAWLVARCRFPGVRLFAWLLLLPLAMPAYIIGYAMTDLLAFPGPVQSALRATFGWRRGDYWFPDIQAPWGAGAMLVLVLYPYVYLLARAAFLDAGGSAFEVARALGHGPWRAFVGVALPLARPAVAAGVVLALMETLADFGTVDYFGVTTLTTLVYRAWFAMGDRVAAGQIASALLLVVLALLWLERRLRRGETARPTRRHVPVARLRLRTGAAVLAVVGCALPVLLGFVLPVLVLGRMHLAGGDAFGAARFLEQARNSLLLAAAAAGLVVGTALVLALAVRLDRGRRVLALVRVATLGYAVPGTVIAVGVLFPLAAFDNALDRLLRDSVGVSTGLLLSGSIAALLFAYLVRFLAVAFGALDAGFAQIPRSMDDVARALGSATAAVTRRVHVPLLRRPILTAALLVFVDVLKELPATLIVRPFNFDTLAVRVYTFAADERLAQASTSALLIVATGLLPVLLISRLITAERRRPASARAALPA